MFDVKITSGLGSVSGCFEMSTRVCLNGETLQNSTRRAVKKKLLFKSYFGAYRGSILPYIAGSIVAPSGNQYKPASTVGTG